MWSWSAASAACALVLLAAGCGGASKVAVARKYAASHYARGAAHVLSATIVEPCPRGPGHVDFGPPLPKQCVRVVVGTPSCKRVDVALYVRGSDVFASDVLSFDGACR